MASCSTCSKTTMTKSTMKKGAIAPFVPNQPDFFEQFYESKICEIPATSNEKSDAFDRLRPKPRTVLDYKISQTDTKMQKRISIGVAKVHVKQTRAEYVLPPPGYEFPPPTPPPTPPDKKRGIVYCTGKGPVWEFEEDKWRRKVERKQKLYPEKLKRLIAANRKYERDKIKREHALLMDKVGPDWYQELSPKQLKTVDNLKNCILKDLKLKTIINTLENIGELGLVLRPDPRHIQMALNECYECPVEFLLVLYQLMNRHRVKYSLNDRLLLSGVVHLTMRETLKELHIRIPSPPPPQKKPKTPPKVEKKKKYKSPYLVPFSFVPKPQKHTGIYKNVHIQYPESPYFSYISELKAEVPVAVVETGKKRKGDSTSASKIILTKKQSGITDAQEKELVNELRAAQEEYNKLAEDDSAPYLRKPSIYVPCDHGLKREGKKNKISNVSSQQIDVAIKMQMPATTDLGAESQPVETCECKITFDETAEVDIASSSSSSHLDYSLREPEPLSPSPQISPENVVSCSTTCRNIGIVTNNIAEKMNINEIEEDEPAEKKSSEKIEEKRVKECKCKKVNKITGESCWPCGKCKTRDQAAEAERQKRIYECNCKEVNNITGESYCPCEECKADQAAKASSKIPIPNMKESQPQNENENTEIVPMMEPKKTCTCLKKYQIQMKMYQEMVDFIYAQHTLMSMQKRYGFTHSPDDPVYVSTDLLPQNECECAMLYQERLMEKARLTQMATPQGVEETPQENVEATDSKEDCTCMKLYKQYDARHASCLEAYQGYLEKIEIDTKEYMEELAQDDRFAQLPQVAQLPQDDSFAQLPQPEQTGKGESENQDTESLKENQKITNQNEENELHTSQTVCQSIGCKQQETGKRVCPCGAPIRDSLDNKCCEVNKDDDNKNTCICACICGGDTPLVCDCASESEESSINSDIKRFIILDKIPCERAKHIEILKKALEVLAEDGYPLAKLPEAYKLPHFKLWMRLRCGKSWTQEDRVDILIQSWIFWRHIGYCGQKVKEKARLVNLSEEEAAKYTWANATVVRNMAAEKTNTYYRQLKQAVIGDTREFFPTTFQYEFPCTGFRDCFFAYQPGKEEACDAFRPWYPHEIKNLRKTC